MHMCACPCEHTCEGQDNFVCHSSSIIHLWVLRRVPSLARSLLRRLNQLASEPQEPASPALFGQIPLTDVYVGSGGKKMESIWQAPNHWATSPAWQLWSLNSPDVNLKCITNAPASYPWCHGPSCSNSGAFKSCFKLKCKMKRSRN